MLYLLIIVILAVVWLMALSLGKAIFRPANANPNKKYRGVKAEKEDQFENVLVTAIGYIKDLVYISDDYESELKANIQRLGLEISPRRVRELQTLYMLASIAVTILLFIFVNKVFAAVSLVGLWFAWNEPIDKIKKQIKARNKAIEEELPDLYTMVYYTYRRGTDSNFKELLEAYKPSASLLFALEIQNIIEDIYFNGEKQALHRFKRRVPLAKVSRFCELLEARLEGLDNISALENFKLEMDEQKLQLVDKMLEKKEKQSKTAGKLLYVTMVVLILVYLGTMMAKNSMGLF